MVDDSRGALDVRGITLSGRTEILRGASAAKMNARIHGKYLTEAALELGPVAEALEHDDVTVRFVPEQGSMWDLRGYEPSRIGLGFSSDDFEFDIAPWVDTRGAWTMDEDHELADSSVLNIRAAGPHPHFEDFYVFVMDRPDGLPYAELRADGRLASLTFEGGEAAEWRRRLSEWLRLPSAEAGLRAGDVALRFRSGSHPGVRVAPVLEPS